MNLRTFYFHKERVKIMKKVFEINSDILRKCGITPVIIDCLNEELEIRSREEIFADVLKGINNAIDERQIQKDSITMKAVEREGV